MNLPQKCQACGSSAWSFETQCIQCGASLAVPAIADEIQPVPAKRNDTDSIPEVDDRSGFRRTGLLCAIAAVACFAVLPKWRPVLVILLISTPVSVAYVVAHAFVARMYRVPCIGLGIWFVPLLVVRCGRCVVRIGGLPLPTAYAKLPGFEDPPASSPDENRPEEVRADEVGPNERRYDTLQPFPRLLINFSGPAVMFLIAVVLLGWPEAWNSMIRGFEQLWMNFRSPRMFGREVLAPFLRTIENGEYRYVVGTFAAKMTAQNMLSIPIATGGTIAIELWELVTGRKVRPRTRILLQYLGVAVLLWLFIATCIATYTAVAAM